MRTRQNKILLYLSDKELQTLERKRRMGNLTRAAFLRSCIMDKQVKAIPTADYQTLYREINAIGNNINQTARAVNMGIATHAEIAELAHQLTQIYTILEGGLAHGDHQD